MSMLNLPNRRTWLACRQVMESISWLQLTLLAAAMFLVALTEGVSFLMLVPMLDTVTGPSQSPRPFPVHFGDVSFGIPLGLMLVLFVGLVALRSLFQHFRAIAGVKVENQVVDALRLKCFAALMRAEWRLISRQRLSDYASLIISNVDRVGFGLNQAVSIVAMGVTALACIAAAFVLSWKLSLFAVACGIAVTFAFRNQRRQALKLGKEQNAAYEDVFAEIQEGLAGIRIAKVFRQQTRHIQRVGGVFRTLRQHQVSFVRRASLGRSALHVGGAALLALTLFLGLNVWHVPVHSLLPIVLLFARLLPIMGSLQQNWENMLHAAPALADTTAMLEELAANSEPEAGDEIAPLPLAHAIQLNGVGVVYTDRVAPAIEDVTLAIPARTTTVIMGPSGAGKSTLADVLMGLVVPDEGEVTIDGVPLTGIDRMRWRESVAYVQQDPFLFHASIRDNLLWAKPQADAGEIDRALRAASATFVQELPDGLDTIVGDGGIRLSGGERQRIVLARALLCAPSMLILDEATSALDTANELAIRQAISDLHGALTVVVIGHRIAMVDTADQLISMEGGRASLSSKDAIVA